MATQPITQEAGGDFIPQEGEVSEPNYEEKARLHGWRPKEEFKGNPDEWVEAKTFAERIDTVMPFLKKDRDAWQKRFAQAEKQIGQLMKAAQGEFNAGVEEAKRQLREAAEVGDMAAFDAAQIRLDSLQKKAVQRDMTRDDDPDEAVGIFRDENAWYDRGGLASASPREAEMRLFADREMERMARAGYQHDHTPSQFMAEVKRRVDEKFPEPAATKPKGVESVGGVTRGGNGKGGAKTFANLPPEARAQFDRFYDRGAYKGKDKATAQAAYAAKYAWE